LNNGKHKLYLRRIKPGQDEIAEPQRGTLGTSFSGVFESLYHHRLSLMIPSNPFLP